MKKTMVIMLLTLLLTAILVPGFAFATGIEGIPADIYKPDLGEAAKSGGGIVKAINFILAIVGIIALAWGLVIFVKDHGLRLLTGKLSFQAAKDPLLGFGLGALLVILAITGGWFQVLQGLYKIFLPIINMLA